TLHQNRISRPLPSLNDTQHHTCVFNIKNNVIL
uniref:Uncharacterized protein n=1 Tax=Amphimedon queenslandica TaxID=400682 RepID=A0A1X7VVM0_AMPQE